MGFTVDWNLEVCPPLLTLRGPQWAVGLSLSKRGSGVCSQHLNTGTLLLVLKGKEIKTPVFLHLIREGTEG